MITCIDFDFDVINFPFLDGNIPKGQSYGIFISQLVRYARINSSFSNFISDCKKLVSKLINQCFSAAANCASVLKHLLINTFMFGVNLVFHCLLIMSFS